MTLSCFLSAILAGGQSRNSAVGACGGQLAHFFHTAIACGKNAGSSRDAGFSCGDETGAVGYTQCLCQGSLGLLSHSLEQTVYTQFMGFSGNRVLQLQTGQCIAPQQRLHNGVQQEGDVLAFA